MDELNGLSNEVLATIDSFCHTSYSSHTNESRYRCVER